MITYKPSLYTVVASNLSFITLLTESVYCLINLKLISLMKSQALLQIKYFLYLIDLVPSCSYTVSHVSHAKNRIFTRATKILYIKYIVQNSYLFIFVNENCLLS
jgi:hypothetical protein